MTKGRALPYKAISHMTYPNQTVT
ncbi:unnamed protein product, partial [Didymodactylos carnosus]